MNGLIILQQQNHLPGAVYPHTIFVTGYLLLQTRKDHQALRPR